THTQLRRCLAFLFSVFLFISSAFSAALPAGYTELEYIRFDGIANTGPYIDTGLKYYSDIPTNKVKFVVDVKVYNNDGDYDTIIGNHSNDGPNVATFTNSHNFYYGTGASAEATNSAIPNPQTRCIITFDIINGFLDIYDKENNIPIGHITGINPVVRTYRVPIFLGAEGYGWGSSGVRYERAEMDLYNAKIYNDGVVVRDFVPVINPSSVVGLYDLVKGVFYPNQGSGTFIAGPVVDTCTYTTMLGTQVCLLESQPSGGYLPVRYNNEKYYLMLDSENDYPIHKNSNNKIKIKINDNTIYNVHDASVVE
ncbi:MAG: hypothetical protein IJL05_00485, partial [Alphaproteobacteria bacterium]|nr:hypothetical protein [Alphaproteobacteria bacterium]